MSKTTNPIRLALEAVLSGEGFSRRGDSWYRRSDEVVEVVNLQKSQYGNQYYINYALWLTALGDATFPKEEKCHIRMRVDITMTDAEQFACLLDLETDMPADERRITIAALLTSKFKPFADRCRSLAGLRELFADGRFRNAMVLIAAKRALINGPAG
jgi:hypothetical protein